MIKFNFLIESAMKQSIEETKFGLLITGSNQK